MSVSRGGAATRDSNELFKEHYVWLPVLIVHRVRVMCSAHAECCCKWPGHRRLCHHHLIAICGPREWFLECVSSLKLARRSGRSRNGACQVSCASWSSFPASPLCTRPVCNRAWLGLMGRVPHSQLSGVKPAGLQPRRAWSQRARGLNWPRPLCMLSGGANKHS